MNQTFMAIGDPVSKQRPRFGHGRTYTPKKTLDYEKLVRTAYLDQCTGRLKPPYRVEMIFGLRIPKSVSQKKRRELAGLPCMKKKDIDNLAKSVLDALNGVAFEDDSQVVDMRVRKMWSTVANVHVSISEVENGTTATMETGT